MVHFTFPSIGHVEKDDAKYRLVPAACDLIRVRRQMEQVAGQGGLFWRSIADANVAFPK